MDKDKKKASDAAYREANKEKMRLYQAEWYIANKERLKIKMADYRKMISESPEKTEKLKAYKIAYRAENREQEIARSAAWAKANPERKKAQDAAWYEANKEYAKKRNMEWHSKNKEKANAARNAWHKAHPGHKAARYALDPSKQKIDEHNRRARKKSNGGKLSKGVVPKLLSFQRNKCSICKKSLKKTGYHVDHIVPLVKGGPNEDRNIQLTCPSCNSKKCAKDPIQFMQEMGYLL